MARRPADDQEDAVTTPRALLLLRLIVQTTVRGGDGKVKRFWVPKTHSQYVGATAVLFERADLPILRAMERRKLIERQPSDTAPHAYASTVSGERFAHERST